MQSRDAGKAANKKELYFTGSYNWTREEANKFRDRLKRAGYKACVYKIHSDPLSRSHRDGFSVYADRSYTDNMSKKDFRIPE
jgi:hypothetical protein